MTIITQKLDRQERALDELECRMMTYFEAAVGMRNFAGPGGQAQVRRIYATLAWVCTSCERDGYPEWLVDLVIERVQRDLLAGDFPLIEASSEQAMGEAQMGEQRQMMPPMRANPFGNPALEEYVEHARPVPPLGLDVLMGEHGPELMRVRRRAPSLGVVLYWLAAVVSVASAAVLFLLSHLNVR